MLQLIIINIYRTKKETHHIELNKSTLRKITSDGPVSLISCKGMSVTATHLSQPVVKHMLKKIGH